MKKVQQGKLGGSKHSKGEPLGLTHPNKAFFKLRSARLPFFYEGMGERKQERKRKQRREEQDR